MNVIFIQKKSVFFSVEYNNISKLMGFAIHSELFLHVLMGVFVTGKHFQHGLVVWMKSSVNWTSHALTSEEGHKKHPGS